MLKQYYCIQLSIIALFIILFITSCTTEKNQHAHVNSTTHHSVNNALKSTTLLTADLSKWEISGDYESNKKIAVPDIPGGQAYRIHIAETKQNPWDVVAHADMQASAKKGDMLLITLWVRAHNVDNEAQSGVLSSIILETTDGKFESIVLSSALVNDKWTKIYAYDYSDRDILPGQVKAVVHLSGAKQTIDLGPVSVSNFGPTARLDQMPKNLIDYPGREKNAPWRKAADERIEQHRKQNIHIQVLDTNEKPIENAKVTVNMQSHAYAFGTFIDHNFAKNIPHKKPFREAFDEIFNYATAPLYWSDFGWQKESSRQEYIENLDNITESNLRWRGHLLVYPAKKFVPSNILALENDPPQMRQAVLKHVDEVLNVLQKYPAPEAIDVTNEARSGSYLTDVTGDDTLVQIFKNAKEKLPNTTLYINEFGLLNGGGNDDYIEQYKAYIKKLKDLGAPVQGIGLQGHFGAALTHPQRIYDILDNFSAMGMPIQITEFDIDTDDEKTQAEFTQDFMKIVFSHPATTAFVAWGFWESDQWRPKGAFIRPDWSRKPNFHAWKDAVYNQWWTNESTKTNAQGESIIRAFKGTHKITVTYKGKVQSKIINLNQKHNLMFSFEQT